MSFYNDYKKGEWKIESEDISMKTLNPYITFECD